MHAAKRNRRGSIQWIVDLGLAGGLVAALAVVFAIDRGRPAPDALSKQGGALQEVEPPVDEPTQQVKTLRLGVTPQSQSFDDMARLLDKLGEGYKYKMFPLDDLRDADKISKYDVIFLTCSGVPETWLKDRIGVSKRAGMIEYTPNAEVMGQVAKNLNEFVAKGGTLYASDLHYDLVAQAFGEFAERFPSRGKKQDGVNAEVVDPGLRELIGGELSLSFDQEDWFPAAFKGEKVVVYLRGTYQPRDGEPRSSPFLVKFPYKDGTVIFTSFHNEKQNSESELKLLRYLVFSAVTADVETKVRKSMVQGGFSPAKNNLFSASPGAAEASSVFHATKAGNLQFVLGFENLGARLKLTVVGPDGAPHEKEGTSTFTIDVPNAVAGDWKYTVTALHLPNENFPFTVTVGEK
ncbi:MAG TPA: hypothetical protein VGX76_10605 [Pirellulales bacterium]|jgi:hypothetical protein|nr:hypothetical protein [Pirellulales bacterium]